MSTILFLIAWYISQTIIKLLRKFSIFVWICRDTTWYIMWYHEYKRILFSRLHHISAVYRMHNIGIETLTWGVCIAVESNWFHCYILTGIITLHHKQIQQNVCVHNTSPTRSMIYSVTILFIMNLIESNFIILRRNTPIY